MGGRFRTGCCLRQMGRLGEAVAEFKGGQVLEKSNSDWEKEIEKTEKLMWAQPDLLVRQLLLNFLPELLSAWSRGGDKTGVLHVQMNGELNELGLAKYWSLRQKINPTAQ